MAKHAKSSARPDIPTRAAARGNHTPTLPTIVAVTFNRLNLRMRARMLGRLLASVGPLALTVIGGGAFAKYVTHARLQEIPVSIDDAAALRGAELVARTEGILVALETAHAIAALADVVEEYGDVDVLVNVSGRGDKDMATLAARLLATEGA